MRKPILLLVDDDPAVLEALESCLEPVFQEVGRLACFADPRDALASVENWSREGRSIAVAVVDQKMPGIPGVEFLGRLGRSREAAHIRAILLTGYSGLDSAVVAKNEGGIDRYLEKPWQPAELQEVARDLFRQYLDSSGTGAYFLFREATSPEDLRILFRLRYEVFRQSGLGEFCAPRPGGMDIDAYDPRARHLGLYLHEVGRLCPVGNMRIVSDSLSPVAESVLDVAGDSAGVGNEPIEPLPLLTYFPDADEVRKHYQELKRGGASVAEPGRLALLPEARSRGTARHMIASTVAYYYYCGLDQAVLTCHPRQRVFYTPFGFRRLERTGDHVIPGIGAPACCLVGSQASVPPPARGRTDVLARSFRKRGSTCYCPTFPECLPDSYITQEFRTIDVFCPLRALEVS